jgi:DNA-binding NarL/FixJ family response regulator
MMSSSRPTRDVATAYDAGASLYIRKPNDLEGVEELIAAIAKNISEVCRVG